MSLLHFVGAVVAYCGALDASVTSWGRTLHRNDLVGGVAGSAHRFWLAVDVVYDVPRPVAERKISAEQLGLRLVVEGDHDHLQPLEWAAG